VEEYDVIVAGGGHGGLVVAGYLAKAGINVCVVERLEYAGGGVVTREVTLPGFKHDLAGTCHGYILLNPLITHDELELQAKYGLQYIIPEQQAAVIFPDDTYLIVYRDVDKTCASIEKFSRKDAEAYRRFYEWASPSLDLIKAGMFSPPPTFGAYASFMDGSEEGRALLRSLMMSSLDICNDWFESDQIKITLTRFVSEGMVAPQAKGTGLSLFLFVPHAHRYGWAVPLGGSGMLSDALVQCITDHGGTIRTSSTIKGIKVEGGEARGVILDTGEEILAKKAVISNLNIKQLFPGMVGAENIAPDFVDKVKRLSHSCFQSMLQSLALEEAPIYRAGAEVGKSFLVELSPWLEEFLRTFDDYSYGYPATSCSTLICSSQYDPSRAPDGKHTLYAYHYEPYNLKGGAARWDGIRQEVADNILQSVQERTTNMGNENILGRSVQSPLDLERMNPAYVQGDQGHIGRYIYQLMGNRPLPRWNYKTPVEKLYMCGPGTHPGAGICGGGRAAVQVVMSDLGIDFEKVIK